LFLVHHLMNKVQVGNKAGLHRFAGRFERAGGLARKSKRYHYQEW